MGSLFPTDARRRPGGRDPGVGGAHLLPLARAATAPGGVDWHGSSIDPATRCRRSEATNTWAVIGAVAGRRAIEHALRTTDLSDLADRPDFRAVVTASSDGLPPFEGPFETNDSIQRIAQSGREVVPSGLAEEVRDKSRLLNFFETYRLRPILSSSGVLDLVSMETKVRHEGLAKWPSAPLRSA
jgi:hypothetical protein